MNCYFELGKQDMVESQNRLGRTWYIVMANAAEKLLDEKLIDSFPGDDGLEK